MKVGFAEVEFTPPIGTIMPGGFLPVESVASCGGLFASAVAFTENDRTVILISMDVLSSKPYYTDDIRMRISKETGVPKDNIMVMAIHTHTGPAVEYKGWHCEANLEVSKNTADKTVEAGIAAWKNREEGKLGIGDCIEPRYSFNRDFYMMDGNIVMNPTDKKNIVKCAGPVDHSVNIMRVDDMNGEIKGFLVNYANHACCHGMSNKNHLSADFPGFMRRALKKYYGEQIKVLFFNGTAGDINCLDFSNHTDTYYWNGLAPETIGQGLAADVIGVSQNMHVDITDPYIDALSEKCITSRRYKTQKDYEWALEIAKDMASHNAVERAYAQEYLKPEEDYPKEVELEVHTIRIGPWTIVGLPSEIYTEIGLRIKWASPYKNTVVFELANGTHGYIAPRYVVNSTTYETKYSPVNSFCGEETADKLVEHSIKQLGKMAHKERVPK